jgi:hypothetical protein
MQVRGCPRGRRELLLEMFYFACEGYLILLRDTIKARLHKIEKVIRWHSRKFFDSIFLLLGNTVTDNVLARTDTSLRARKSGS